MQKRRIEAPRECREEQIDDRSECCVSKKNQSRRNNSQMLELHRKREQEYRETEQDVRETFFILIG
jgi:hypothetical protein